MKGKSYTGRSRMKKCCRQGNAEGGDYCGEEILQAKKYRSRRKVDGETRMKAKGSWRGVYQTPGRRRNLVIRV